MTVFDTDITTDIIQSRLAVVDRAKAVPRDEQAVTIVTAEEMLRGRLNFIRQVESGKVRASLEEAYALLDRTLEQLRHLRILQYDDIADVLFRNWRAMKLRVGTKDLRIAAIVFASKAKLATRNARDFSQVPGLDLEIWP